MFFGVLFRTGAKHSSPTCLLPGSWHEMRGDVQAGGYHGDLMLLHDVATYTWSCSFRLVGALEIFLVFVQIEE